MGKRGPPSISLIVARAANGVIGRDNALPWRLPADLQRFKALTMGKPILMGRRTFESIGRPLPGRVNIVLTRDPAWSAQGVVAARGFDEALEHAGSVPEVFVIGGADLFRLALPFAQHVYLTDVHADVQGDIKFPAFEPQEWCEVQQSTHPADARNEYAMTFRTLERRAL